MSTSRLLPFVLGISLGIVGSAVASIPLGRAAALTGQAQDSAARLASLSEQVADVRLRGRFQSEIKHLGETLDDLGALFESDTKPSPQERTRLRAPGVEVDEDDRGLRVRAPGITIDEDGDGVRVRLPGMIFDERAPADPRPANPSTERRRPAPTPAPAPAPEPAPAQPMNSGQMQSLLAQINGASFSDDKVQVVKSAASSNWFTCSQVIAVMQALNFDDDRVEAAAIMHPRVVNKDEWYTVYSGLGFSSSRDKLRARVGD